MAYYRGFAIGGTSIPVSGVSVSTARNPVAEETMGSVGQPRIYGGAYLATGQLDAPYRKTALDPLRESLLGGSEKIEELPEEPWISDALLSDEFNNGVAFDRFMITSMSFDLKVKDYARSSFQFIAGKATKGTGVSQTQFSDDDPILLFYNAIVSVGDEEIKSSGVTINIERPIDQDYYILGSPLLYNYCQSGPATVTGTLTFAPKEWEHLNFALDSIKDDTYEPSASNLNSLNFGGGDPCSMMNMKVQLHTPCGGAVAQTITVDSIKLQDLSISGQGRSKFDKQLNWTAEIADDRNIHFT